MVAAAWVMQMIRDHLLVIYNPWAATDEVIRW